MTFFLGGGGREASLKERLPLRGDKLLDCFTEVLGVEGEEGRGGVV